MIETVNKIKEMEEKKAELTLSQLSQQGEKQSPPQQQQEITDDKTKETNVLFEQLPTYYNDDDDDDDDDSESENAKDEEEVEENNNNNNNNNNSNNNNKTSTKIENRKSITIITKQLSHNHHQQVQPVAEQQSIKVIATKKARLANNSNGTTTTTTTTTTMAYSLDCKMNQVLPRLYISDDVIARNKSMLVKYKITHILNLTTNVPNKFEPDITYLKIVIFDFETQNISQYFSESFEFIENALKQDEQNRVLVHCNAGISRSASFVIAYLLQKRVFKRYKDAYNHLKKARPVIEPNRGFEKQLINFEKRIRKNKGCSIM